MTTTMILLIAVAPTQAVLELTSNSQMATSPATTLFPVASTAIFPVNCILDYVAQLILGVKTPFDCQMICKFTTDCTNFTWEDGGYCHLVNKPDWLEWDDNKISGSRDCHWDDCSARNINCPPRMKSDQPRK